MYWRGPIRVEGGAYRKVEGVYFAKWRGYILLNGGGVYIAKWRGSQSGGGVFYILQGKCYNHMNCRACI